MGFHNTAGRVLHSSHSSCQMLCVWWDRYRKLLEGSF